MMMPMVHVFLVVLFVVACTTGRHSKSFVVDGAVITTINTDALQSLVSDVKRTIIPSLVSFLNSRMDLSISTQIGNCCQTGDVGVKASIKLQNLRFDPDLDLSLDTIPTATANKGIITFNLQNTKIMTSISSQFAIAYKIGDTECNPIVQAIFSLPKLSFNVNLIPKFDTIFDNINENFSASAFQISFGNIQINPVQLQLSVQDGNKEDSNRPICNDNVFSKFTDVTNLAAALLSNITTTQFQQLIPQFLNPLFSTIPIAYDLPIEMLNGYLQIGLGLQGIQSTDQDISTAIGTSFSSTLLQPEWRNGYSYQRTIDDDNTTIADDGSGDSNTIFNNDDDDRLIQVKLAYPPINNFIAAMWHQTWANLANDPSVQENAEDFCSMPSFSSDLPTNTDPCPFPPIRSSPISFLDQFALRILFFFYSDFKYQAAIEPPILDMNVVVVETINDDNTTDTNTTNITTTTNTFLQGRVPSKFVIRGKKRRASSGNTTNPEETVALIEMDIVFETDIPGYDKSTGIIQFAGFNFRIENVASQTKRLNVLSSMIIQLSTRFINNLIQNRLLEPINNAIQLGLNYIPIKIPKINNLPLPKHNIQFTLPDFIVNFTDNLLDFKSNLDIAVMGPASSMVYDNNDTIVGTLPEINVEDIIGTSSDGTTDEGSDIVLIYSSFTDPSISNTSLVQTSRTTSDGSIQQYINGQWV